MAVGAAADVLTKSWAFSLSPPPPSSGLPVIDGFLHVHNTENSGAMWSLFQGVQREVWVAIRGGVFLLLGWVFVRNPPARLWAVMGFALVLAGALGNLYDNVFHTEGRVRDWIGLHFGSYTFPIFNLADTQICVGAPLLLLHFYGEGESAPDKEREGRSPETGGEGAA